MEPYTIYNIIFNIILIIIFTSIIIIQIKNRPKDKLTGLQDRDSFWYMLDIKTKKKEDMYVILITLDDFKLVNREFGYKNGNRFIQAISEYIVTIAPKGCVARYGGDEFAVILDKNINIDEWAENIFDKFEQSWIIDNLKYTISVSICILECPTIAGNTEDIVSLLSYTNSYAKKSGKSIVVRCNEEFKSQLYRRNKISSHLKKVIDEAKMDVYYQPIFDVKNRKFNIAEAEPLFRLEHDEIGDIPPSEFLPIAEEAGYIADIGYILIDKVCKYIVSLKEQMEEVPVISVNFTRQQLLYDGALDKILSIISNYKLSPSNIAIEIPEEVFAQNYSKVADKVREFDAAGIQIFLDGFGTGFSNIHHILSLPFKIIKINKDMIWEAEKNDSILLLVSALTAVFEETGMQILASGIDSEGIKKIADLLFMDYLQGYYFSEPMEGNKAVEYYLREASDNDMFEVILDDVLSSIEELDNI